MNSSKKPSVTGEYLFENVVAINESVNKLSVSHPLVSNLYKEVGNLFVKAKTVRLDGKKIFSEEETPSYSKDDLSDFKRSGVFAIEYDHPFFYPGMDLAGIGLDRFNGLLCLDRDRDHRGSRLCFFPIVRPETIQNKQ